MTKQKYLYSTILLMTYGGTFRIKTHNPIRQVFFTLWRFILNLTLLFFMLSCFIDLRIKGFTKLELVSKHYVYFGASVYIIFRVNFHYINEGIPNDIVNQMRNVFKYKTEIGFAEKDLSFYVKITNIVTFLWMFYGSLLGQCDILISAIFKKERELTIPMWFPFDWSVSPYYELAVFVQMFVQEALIVMSLGMDTFFANTIILTSGQFKLLGWELKHILHKTLLQNNIQLDAILAFMHSSHATKADSNRTSISAVYNTINSEKFRINLLENLKVLADFHHFLLTISSRLDQFFSTVNLMCFCIILTAAVLLEYAVIMTQDMMFRVLIGLYVLAALTMLFFPCFFGNLLTSHAEAFVSDLYDLPWYLCDEKFKTNFKMLQQKAGKPVLLTIGKFGELSLQTFLWIIKTSYSYLTVLRHVTEDV